MRNDSAPEKDCRYTRRNSRLARACLDDLYGIYKDAAATGAVCPNRSDLATTIGISPDTLRIAHKMLERDGRIRFEYVKGAGVRVYVPEIDRRTAPWRRGLPSGAVLKRRRCLRCRQWFDSWGAGNRICCERPADTPIDALGQPTLYSW